MTYRTTIDEIAIALQGTKRGDDYICRCPAHDDRDPSLSLTEKDGKILVHCHTGCSQDAVIAALEARGLWGRGYEPQGYARKRANGGCSLQDYAEAKQLPLDFLKDIGLSETPWNQGKAIKIPYCNERGEQTAIRFRLGLTKDADRFRWRHGDKPMLYGLERLDRDADYVVFVEGESDAQTLWYHKINAVGLPGAANWREDRDAKHLDGFERIYVVIEPDKGGEAVRKWVSGSSIRDRVWFVPMAEDVSALHCEGPADFKPRWTALLAQAERYIDAEERAKEIEKQEAWDVCHELATAPNILDQLELDLRRRGFVGDASIAKLLYLATTSRLLARPVSVAVKGVSSGGKSYVVDRVLEFFPDRAFYKLTAMSERALAYSEEPLSHRVLVVAEASGMSGELATYFIRSLLSEGYINYEFVEKSDQGLRTRRITKEGPTGLIVTTTRVNLHPENETRLISVTVKDTAEQTAAILLAAAEDEIESLDFSEWCSFQIWLEHSDLDVAVPYFKSLAKAIPEPVPVRMRRDFPSIVSLIKTHAILHQRNRERDERGRIIATLEDYRAVRDLAAEVIAEGVGRSVSPGVRETVDCVRSHGGPLNYTQIAKALGIDPSSAMRRVAQAIERGYLRNLEERGHQTAQIVPGEAMPDDESILPTVERLRDCMENEEIDTPSPSTEEVEQ